MDVTNEDQVNAGVEKTVSTFGKVDILVSNAGIQIVHQIEDFPFADWKEDAGDLPGRRLFDDEGVRQAHVLAGQRHADLHGVGAQPRSFAAKSAYVAAKHGILGLARTMAKEGAKHNVRSNVTIRPGFVLTPRQDRRLISFD